MNTNEVLIEDLIALVAVFFEVTSSSVISSMTSLVGALHRSRSEETQQLGPWAATNERMPWEGNETCEVVQGFNGDDSGTSL